MDPNLEALIADLGDEAPSVLEQFLKVYQLGKIAGDRQGFERGYAEGVAETKQDADGVDPKNRLPLEASVTELEMENYIRHIFIRELGPDTTIGDIMNMSASDIFRLRDFGQKAGLRLMEALRKAGHNRNDLL